MLSNLLKNLSILKKFLFINFIFFTIIGIFLFIYLKNVQPNLIKKKSSNHIEVINNTIDNLTRLNVEFVEDDIRKFLFSTRFLFQNLDRVIFFDNQLNLIGDTDTLDLDPRSFSQRLDIVEFEVFFENNDKKLDIFIKHPQYEPRPLSMGSGAEKTIAAMAIRLGLISITNLPKSELFILDEPATALDQEHMEGFIRLLDMIKGQFKTVLLVSHLEVLKDVVDMTIDIEKSKGYAKVKLK